MASLVTRSVVVSGLSVAAIGGYFVVNYATHSVALNGACDSSQECVAPYICTADYNAKIRALQIGVTPRVGHCIDVTGVFDSRAGLQADFDAMPESTDATMVIARGPEYFLPPLAKILIDTPSMPGGAASQTGCTIAAGSGTITCSGAPTVFQPEDLDRAVIVPGAGTPGVDPDGGGPAGVGDLVSRFIRFEGSNPTLEGKQADLVNTAVTSVIAPGVTITWTRLSHGLHVTRRVSLNMSGSQLRFTTANISGTAFFIDGSLVANPHEAGDPSFPAYSEIRNGAFAANPGTINTTEGIRPWASNMTLENVAVNAFGRCIHAWGSPETTNLNHHVWTNVKVNGCYGMGVVSHGNDFNGSILIGTYFTGGNGLYEHSGLGNSWFGSHFEGTNSIASNDPLYNGSGLAVSMDIDGGTHCTVSGVYWEADNPAPIVGTTGAANCAFLGGGEVPQLPVSVLTRIGLARSRGRFSDNPNIVPFDIMGDSTAGNNDYWYRAQYRGSSTDHGTPGSADTYATLCGFFAGFDGVRRYGCRTEAQALPFIEFGGGASGFGQAYLNGSPIGPARYEPVLNHGNITTLTHLAATVSVPGCDINDTIILSPNAALTAGVVPSHARCSARGTLSVSLAVPGSVDVDPASATYNYRSGTALTSQHAAASLDHASIAAGTVGEASITLPGIQANDVVFCSPRTAISAACAGCAGLIYSGARASGPDTGQVMLGNMTTGALDPTAIVWDCAYGAIKGAYRGSFAADAPSTNGGAISNVTGTLTSVATTHTVACSPTGALPTNFAVALPRASTANTISLSFVNLDTVAHDPVSVTFTCASVPP